MCFSNQKNKSNPKQLNAWLGLTAARVTTYRFGISRPKAKQRTSTTTGVKDLTCVGCGRARACMRARLQLVGFAVTAVHRGRTAAIEDDSALGHRLPQSLGLGGNRVTGSGSSGSHVVAMRRSGASTMITKFTSGAEVPTHDLKGWDGGAVGRWCGVVWGGVGWGGAGRWWGGGGVVLIA